MSKILIGIDPDVDKSGFARIEGNQLKLDNLSFFDLYEELKFYKELEVKPVVYIECGFLNKSNFHKKAGMSAALNAKIGERTGANFETAKKIVEMCEYLKMPYVKIQPKASKITNDYFKKITGINARTNQEQRDAMMLIWGR
ncbi:hypothetical protein ACM55H_05335 [Flavobacterium sp. ZT3R17]|uniref:hypothetical protein n=1 Tax=Flavobacterium cryoconiti TaxID=3398736 RepID=UPI003A8C07B2